MTTVQTIDVKGLARLIELKKDICLIDVRMPAEYETVHAAGAKLLPLTELNPKRFMDGRTKGKDELVYLICKGGNRSRKAAEMFVSEGFENVVSVEGGTEAWVAAGLPVEKGGRSVLPLDRQIQLTAGLMALSGAILGTWVNPWFYLLCGIVGFGLTIAGLTGFCGMAIVMAKMPWNQGRSCNDGSCCSGK